jgi:hypothetical protein
MLGDIHGNLSLIEHGRQHMIAEDNITAFNIRQQH